MNLSLTLIKNEKVEHYIIFLNLILKGILYLIIDIDAIYYLYKAVSLFLIV